MPDPSGPTPPGTWRAGLVADRSEGLPRSHQRGVSLRRLRVAIPGVVWVTPEQLYWAPHGRWRHLGAREFGLRRAPIDEIQVTTFWRAAGIVVSAGDDQVWLRMRRGEEQELVRSPGG